VAKTAVPARIVESRRCLVRVVLAISATWLLFWTLIGGAFFTVASPGLLPSGDIRLASLMVFAPPLLLIAAVMIGAAALSGARCSRGRLSRRIGI
jgi:hypothetical protein